MPLVTGPATERPLSSPVAKSLMTMQEVMAAQCEQHVGDSVDVAVVQGGGALACHRLLIGDAALGKGPPMAPNASQIEGRENLPSKDEPAVYVANHQSFLVRWPRTFGPVLFFPSPHLFSR